jgi:hypothetical protein
MAQEETGNARTSGRTSAKTAQTNQSGQAGKEGQATQPGTAQDAAGAQAAAEEFTLAVATALSGQMAAVMKEVFAEQRSLFAAQAELREADYVLVRNMVEEQQARRQQDAELLEKINRQAEAKPTGPVGGRRVDADPGQLLLGLQFNALSNVLGSRKRTRTGRDDSLMEPPEITTAPTASGAGPVRYRMTFKAPFPSGAATVGIQYLDNTPRDLVQVGSLQNRSLDLATDQVQYVELLDGRALPIAFGIPYRR